MWTWAYALGVFSRQDMPIVPSLPPGNGQSYIDISLAIRNVNGPSTERPVDLVLVKSSDIERVFVTDDKTGNLVCENGELSLKEDGDRYLRRETLQWSRSDDSTIDVKRKFDIKSTALYHIILTQCPTNDSVPRTMKMAGTMTTMNPYGHLYGESSGSLPYFAIHTLIYVAVSIWWTFRFVKYRQDSLMLQVWISGLLLVCIVEGVLLFTGRFIENVAGEKFSLVLSLSIVTSLIKKTVARMLLVIVSQGFGTIKTTINTPWILIFFGLFYFIAAGIHEIAFMLYQLRVVDSLFTLFSMAPSAVMDGFLIAWVLSSLAATIKELTERNQEKKLTLFQRLLIVIVGYICCSMLVLAFQGPFMTSGIYIPLFFLMWVFDAIWHFAFMIAFFAVVWLWKPSPNNRFYAYAEQLAGDDLNEREFSLGFDSDDEIDMEMEIVFHHDGVDEHVGGTAS